MKADIEKLTLTDNELQGFIGIQDLKRAKDVNTKDDIPKQSERIIRPSIIVKCDNLAESLFQRKKERLEILSGISRSGLFITFLGCPVSAILLDALEVPASDGAFTAFITIFVTLVVGFLIFFLILRILLVSFIENGKSRISFPKQPTRLGTLLDEVDKYNEVVHHILTIEQLHDIGQSGGIDDREHVLEVLNSMRADLVRALQTDKILRDNPNFRIENVFSETIPLVETLKFSADAQETERLVKEALDIGLRVQEEMKKLW